VRLVLANHSSYPRVGDSRESQRLRRAYAQRETGELDEAGYLDVARDYAAEIMREQAEAGCDVVTDGQVHHYDLISHPTGRLGGTQIDGLLRFFDTNHLVRRPEITGELTGSVGAAEDWTAATSVSPKPVKAVLTGPYTLARYSILREDSPYPDVISLAHAYAERLADDITALAAAGCELVQIEEPSLLRHPEDAEGVRGALAKAVSGKGALRVSLVTYFGDATPLYHELVHMPCDMLGFDLTYGPGLAQVIAEQGADRPVALGAIDGRNTKLDDVTSVARVVDLVARKLDAAGIEEIHLQPSCGLEYLPRDRAVRKLGRIREVADAVQGVVA
jgi:5-methyltetrahydropteroyltriglutamate--homocysteine methyltransferase